MKQRILRLVIVFLLLSPVLASAASPTVFPSDRLEDRGTLDLHVTWNGTNVVGAPVYLYTENGTCLDVCKATDARGHVQFTLPSTPHNFRVEYKGKEYWTGTLFAIPDQKLEVEAPLERLADISTNNPTAARYDGEPPIYNHDPVQVASLGTYVGILSQAAVAQVQPQPKVYYFITDHLGTPMKMTDESGAVVWSADYRPFGELSVGNAAVENNFRFPGQYYDLEIGLHYNWNRYYDPRTGGYTTPDPSDIVLGLNHLYRYAIGNPIIYADPFGLAPGDVYLFTGGGLAPVISKFSRGPYGHAAIEISGNRVLSSGVDEDGELKVYITELGKELAGRSFDVFLPSSVIDIEGLDAYAMEMAGKAYIGGNTCSAITAGGVSAGSKDKDACDWDKPNWLISPNYIGNDPRFNTLYQYLKSVKYLGGGYRIITPTGSYFSTCPR